MLIRHCASRHAGERYIGSTDTPLTRTGEDQACKLAARLKHMAIGSVLASPSKRALDTAKPAVVGTGLSIMVDADLREIDFGKWEGLSFREIEQRDPDLVAEWAQGGMDFCFPGGESLSAFGERICRGSERLMMLPEEKVAAVTHGGVIRFLVCHFLGLSFQSHFLFDIQHGSITRFRFESGRTVLAGLNDCVHLEEF